MTQAGCPPQQMRRVHCDLIHHRVVVPGLLPLISADDLGEAMQNLIYGAAGEREVRVGHRLLATLGYRSPGIEEPDDEVGSRPHVERNPVTIDIEIARRHADSRTEGRS
nr:hypothetical protein [uncultured Lichenicoccus sp.]